MTYIMLIAVIIAIIVSVVVICCCVVAGRADKIAEESRDNDRD